MTFKLLCSAFFVFSFALYAKGDKIDKIAYIRAVEFHLTPEQIEDIQKEFDISNVVDKLSDLNGKFFRQYREMLHNGPAKNRMYTKSSLAFNVGRQAKAMRETLVDGKKFGALHAHLAEERIEADLELLKLDETAQGEDEESLNEAAKKAMKLYEKLFKQKCSERYQEYRELVEFTQKSKNRN